MKNLRACKAFLRSPRLAAAVLLGAAILALGACGGGGGDPGSDNPTLPGGVPAGLERFYAQKLIFGTCKGYATTSDDATAFANTAYECAQLEVPLNYEKPDGRVAQVALLRVPARGEPGKRVGSLLLNPGGPGFSGMSHAPVVSNALGDHAITRQFDLIGFDPRGVGASIPALDCYSDAEREAGAILSTLNSGAKDYTADETRQLYQKCAARSGGEEVLAHVGTRDAARDMDVLRAVVGDAKLSFMGASYGTRLGAIYAEMFPQNVRALVLDAALDPTATSTAAHRLVTFGGFGRGFDNMAAFCAKNPTCPLGTDPKQDATAFQKLLQSLIDKPITLADGRKLTYTAALTGLVLPLYSEAGWPGIIQGITELKAGSGRTLMLYRDLAEQRSSDGRYGNSSEAQMAIECVDEDHYTPEQESALKRDVFKVAPFLDTGRLIKARNLCEHWSVKPTLGFPYAQNIQGLPKTLVVSVTRDPATPHQSGINLAGTLGASLLTVEGEQHGVALIGGNACVNDLVADYLINLKTPADGASCTLEKK